MKKFRRKPLVVEAVQVTDNTFGDPLPKSDHITDASYDPCRRRVLVYPPEGTMHADIGDWIILDVDGKFRTCKGDVFQETYEPVEDILATLHQKKLSNR